jgi:nucleoside-diphosphate-sugar epimerase
MREMRILLTGASSFTGAWFAKALSGAGHEVTAALRGTRAGYQGLKAQRLAWIGCELAENAPFGSHAFLATIEGGHFDILCHHAAEVTNYRSADFDVAAALAANTYRIGDVIAALHRTGCSRILLTGTIFEPGEGAGDMPLRAFNAYGLSKNLTAQLFDFHAGDLGLGKFVIANPFGPYEEPRFTDYLLRQWKDGKPAKIQAPEYVRDYVPVALMADAYVRFAEKLAPGTRMKTTPSCYAETQAHFARRFAGEIGTRLALETPLEFAVQTVFDEPLTRVGTDPVARDGQDTAWDGLAQYYARHFQIARKP